MLFWCCIPIKQEIKRKEEADFIVCGINGFGDMELQ